jgi:hypothetical protein
MTLLGIFRRVRSLRLAQDGLEGIGQGWMHHILYAGVLGVDVPEMHP